MKDLRERTWAEVSVGNMVYNMERLREALPAGTRFLGVVKADAYGHGAVEAARALEAHGAEYLAVAAADEALELRNAGVALPILILGPVFPARAPELAARGVTLAVGGMETARAYSAQAARSGSTLRIHIKIDTGMSRTGFAWTDVSEIAAACRLPGIEAEGVFTHFARSDEDGAAAEDYTREQYRRFTSALDALAQQGLRFSLRHCANSGGTLFYPELTAMDMVRPGIALYGYGDESGKLGLRPCMRLMSRIALVKTYPAGTPVSYGGTFVTQRETRLGVIPIGYADGLHRCISGKCSFYVEGRGFAPQRGRICMDMCMLDLTELPEAGIGDTVELFGDHARLETMAQAAGTITYELLCAVSKRVPRFFV